MSDLENPLALVPTEDLLNEISRRSSVACLHVLQRTAHNEVKLHRVCTWRDTSIFEAIGVLTTLQVQMHGLLQQAQQGPPDQPRV
jgi:hypothetical protein